MSLIDKINDKSAKVGVIGLGYVGLPLAIEFTKAGFEVTGIDLDKKSKFYKFWKNYIKDVDDLILKKAVKKKLLKSTSDYSEVSNLDAVSICVPTPLNKEKSRYFLHSFSYGRNKGLHSR